MTKEEALEILERDDKGMLSGRFSIDDFKAIEKLKETIKDLNSCGEAISREEAILQIQRYGVGCLDSDDFTPEACERFVIDLLKKLPTVYTRKKSQWEYVADGIARENCFVTVSYGHYRCKNCGHEVLHKEQFCGKCGAEMGEVASYD